MSEAAKTFRPGQPSNEAPEAPNQNGGGKDPNIITQWPDEANALIVKFICDPLYDNGKKVYRPARYFGHPTGPQERDKARHICRSFFGEKILPENDKFWEICKAMGALKKAGQVNGPEYKVLKEQVKTFKPSERGYFLIVQPNSKAIKALRVPGQAIDVLMGRKADNYHKEEIPSLINVLTAKGMSPFDLANSKGWIKMYKKGEGIDTEYFVKPAEVEVQGETKDGKKIRYQEEFEGMVDAHLLSDNVTLAEIPNVIEFEKRFAWTLEESQAFVKAEGTLVGVPAKALKREARNGPTGVAEASEPTTEVPDAQAQFETVSEDAIPY